MVPWKKTSEIPNKQFFYPKPKTTREMAALIFEKALREALSPMKDTQTLWLSRSKKGDKHC